MPDKQYFVHYSRKIVSTKKERIHFSSFMWDTFLKELFCNGQDADYVVHSAILVTKGRNKDAITK